MRTGKLSPEKLTLESFLTDVWLPTKSGKRRKTQLGYEWKIKGCIAPYIGHMPLKNVDVYIVELWMQDLARDGKSPQTIVHARAVLKNAMKAAVRWKLIEADPTEGTERPVVDHQPTVLSPEQMNEYLTAFAGHQLEPIVAVAIAGGLRRSEACALTWADVDFDEGTISITKGLHQEGSDVWIEEPKSKTSRRTIALPDWAMEILRPLRGVGPLVPDGAAPMPPNKVSRLFASHAEDMKLPHIPFRDLRNSHGTFLFDAGVGMEYIADRLGHSDTAITRKHYVARSHVNAERVSVAALASIRVCQSVPISEAKHGRNPAESVNASEVSVTKAQ
jgi:integrase